MFFEQSEHSITTSSYFYHKSLHALFKPHRAAKLVIPGCSPPLVIPLTKNLPWLFIFLLNKVQAPLHNILVLPWFGTILGITPCCHDFGTSPYLTAQLPSPKLTLSFSLCRLCWKHYLSGKSFPYPLYPFWKLSQKTSSSRIVGNLSCFGVFTVPFPLMIYYITTTWAHIFTMRSF